jgi:DNA-binding MltR family transcriptional regulator
MANNTAQWFKILNEEFAGTSDRSCVIVAASILDHLILELLRARLVPNSTSQDSLFDGGNAPLGAFSARIDLAYRIGSISAQFARDLHVIRRMRNDLAHSIVGRDFSDPGLADQVLHLLTSLNIKKRCSFLLKPPYDTVRGQFIVCIIVILGHLDDYVRSMPSLPMLEPDGVYIYELVDGSAEKG